MSYCEWCGCTPAAVSTPDWALCRECYRAMRADEMVDHAIDNFEYCGTCDGALNASGSCATCVVRDLVAGRRAMVKL